MRSKNIMGIDMDTSEKAQKISFKNIFHVWWKFYWRYVFFMVTLLLLNGFVVNQAAKFMSSEAVYKNVLLVGNGTIYVCVSLLIFLLILGAKINRSQFLLVPAKLAREEHTNSKVKISPLQLLLSWWPFFWRFTLFLLLIAGTLGAFLPHIFELLGINPFKAIHNTIYVSSISAIPASFIVFILLMRRKQGKRKLDLIPIKE